MSAMKSDSFCVPFSKLEKAAIAELRNAHPGALPISVEWRLEGGSGAAVVWWVPSPALTPAPKTSSSPGVMVGQVWERRDGSRVTLEHVRGEYASYYLTSGSRPQFRSVRIDLLLRRWKLVPGGEK